VDPREPVDRRVAAAVMDPAVAVAVMDPAAVVDPVVTVA
jgi:hypothetical protein